MSDAGQDFTLGERKFILIGTAHISQKSIDEVSRVIREEKPGLVCIELDQGRYNSMTEKESWEKLDLIKAFKEGKGFLLLANLVLAGFQRRMGRELGVKPGEEMKTAVETARELGIPYALCDREVQITLRRAWARCGLWSKCKLLAALLSGALGTEQMSAGEIENLKNQGELDGMMAELAEYLPQVKETLIDERDQYLAAKIWEAAQSMTDPEAPVAAVVGAGHLEGLKTHLKALAAGGASGGTEATDVAALDAIPPATPLSKTLPWIFPAFLALLIALGFFRSGADLSLTMLLRWVLWNGSLAALGALLALAHPLAILVSFLGAPVATMNPFIGVGLFAGVAEATLRKPRVGDAETMAQDISSLRGIYRNRITRALLVFFLSSLGGVLGNVISIPSLAGILFK
jgi:pheromone shutdown-related protein TraB